MAAAKPQKDLAAAMFVYCQKSLQFQNNCSIRSEVAEIEA